MTGDLIINNKDAYTEWGMSMGDGFIENMLIPSAMKPFVENASRLEHGKRVLVNSPKVEPREVTVTFHIQGKTETEYMGHYKQFLNELQGGTIHIKIPKVGNEVYKLIYQRATSFTQNYKRTSSKLSVKFEEPNPMDREEHNSK